MITTYQIQNVLRVYGNQLKKRNIDIKNDPDPTPYARDYVDISVEARSKQALNQVSNDLISQITPKDGKHNTEQQNPADNLSSGSVGDENISIE